MHYYIHHLINARAPTCQSCLRISTQLIMFSFRLMAHNIYISHCLYLPLHKSSAEPLSILSSPTCACTCSSRILVLVPVSVPGIKTVQKFLWVFFTCNKHMPAFESINPVLAFVSEHELEKEASSVLSSFYTESPSNKLNNM